MNRAQGVVIILAIIGIGTAFGMYNAGKDNSHIEGMNYSNYSSWLVVGFVGLGCATTLGLYYYYNYTKRGTVAKIVTVIIVAFFLMPFAQLFTALIGWMFNADSADIQIDTAADGDFQINSAQVRDYKNIDKSSGLWTFPFRMISGDDQYQVVAEINCTNFSVNGTTALLYNDTTASLQGFNIERQTVTAKISPETQPGDFDLVSAKTLVFNHVPQQLESASKLIVYFNLSLYDSTGSLLGSWIVHTDPRLSYWTLDTAV